MKQTFIRISVLTEEPTTDIELGKKLIAALEQVDSRLKPDFFSNREEKIDKIFSSVDDISENWAPLAKSEFQGRTRFYPVHFCWKRLKNIKSQGVVYHTQTVGDGRDIHLGKIELKIFGLKDEVDSYSLLKKWVSELRPKFAMAHLFTTEQLYKVKFSSPQTTFRLGHAGVHLKKSGIPDLAWATYFGDEYSVQVPSEKLAEAGFFVDKTEHGVMLRITDDLYDIKKDFSSFDAERSRAADLFPENFFYGRGEQLMGSDET